MKQDASGSRAGQSEESAVRNATSPVVSVPVAALYVDPRGPYPKLPGVDAWDESRDARAYSGPWPVVAHPPCGPWGRLRHMCTKQDPSCGLRAVEQVRAFGGVLEHPEYSTLWDRCGLPKPGELPDAFGGRTVRVEQVAWGHSCRKATWLYYVGVTLSGLRSGGTPTHCVSRDARRARRNRYTLKRTGTRANMLTPPAFAEWLVSLARSVSGIRNGSPCRD